MSEKLKKLFDELGIGREKLENFNRMELYEILKKVNCEVWSGEVINGFTGEVMGVRYDEIWREFYEV